MKSETGNALAIILFYLMEEWQKDEIEIPKERFEKLEEKLKNTSMELRGTGNSLKIKKVLNKEKSSDDFKNILKTTLEEIIKDL